MRKIFYFMLKNFYSNSEKDRIKIHNILHEKVENTYTDQTSLGNLYNSYIEFLMGNPIVQNAVGSDDIMIIGNIKKGMVHSYDKAVSYILKESIL